MSAPLAPDASIEYPSSDAVDGPEDFGAENDEAPTMPDTPDTRRRKPASND